MENLKEDTNKSFNYNVEYNEEDQNDSNETKALSPVMELLYTLKVKDVMEVEVVLIKRKMGY